MKIFQSPGDGKCLSACIATLLGLTLEEVPKFGIDGYTQWSEADKWLGSRGMMLATSGFTMILHPKGLLIASGRTSRGTRHAVLVDGNDNLWHDPHPGGEGLGEGDIEYSVLAFLPKWLRVEG